MACIWLCHKDKVYVKGNAMESLTKISQHMKNLGFVYRSYNMRDLTLDVPDTNKDWKNIWFFISLEGLKVD